MKELMVEKQKAVLNRHGEIKRPLNLEKEQLRKVRKEIQLHVEGLLSLLQRNQTEISPKLAIKME